MASIGNVSSTLEDAEKDKRVGAPLDDQLDEGESSDKELPEPIRPPRKMPSLPPIGISQVKDLLIKMPEQNIMRQVANNLTSGAYHSDDSGSEMAMQGLFDCILETTLHNNDDDNDEENSPKEMPCGFCSKIFNTKMRLQTHILVTHSQEDPSLLNVTHVAPRRELQRSLSNSKTTGSESDSKARPFSQGLFNMEVTQAVEDDLVKHLPPKQRVKLNPKARLIARDQSELHQSRKSLDVSGDTSGIHPIPKTKIIKDTALSKDVPSSKEDVQSRSSYIGDNEDLSSNRLSSQKTDTEKREADEPKITRLRGRSGSKSLPESSSSPSSSSVQSPGPSGEQRRSSRHQVKLNESISSSVSTPKRKTRDSASNSESKKLRTSADAPEIEKKRSYPTRRNR